MALDPTLQNRLDALLSEGGNALPVAAALPPLQNALTRTSNAVLVAPPGAGKTTLVPLALLDAPWRGDGRIVMLEPRRLATRAAATRMSELMGEQPGGLVSAAPGWMARHRSARASR